MGTVRHLLFATVQIETLLKTSAVLPNNHAEKLMQEFL